MWRSRCFFWLFCKWLWTDLLGLDWPHIVIYSSYKIIDYINHPNLSKPDPSFSERAIIQASIQRPHSSPRINHPTINPKQPSTLSSAQTPPPPHRPKRPLPSSPSPHSSRHRALAQGTYRSRPLPSHSSAAAHPCREQWHAAAGSTARPARLSPSPSRLGLGLGWVCA